MINLYNKAGVLQGQINAAAFDLNKPVQGTSVQGLVQLGQSNGLNPATWSPYYVMAADLP